MADSRRIGQLQRPQGLFAGKDQGPQFVEFTDRIGIPRAGSGQLQGMDREVLCEPVRQRAGG